MISRSEYDRAAAWAAKTLEQAGIVITPEERARLEVADLGLGRLEQTGLQVLTYINTERCCAKELIMMPGQTCPEHYHPPVERRARQGGNLSLPLGHRVPVRTRRT